MKNIFITLLCFLSIWSFDLHVGKCESTKTKHLRVASVLGLTGGAAYHSEGIRRGIELAREDLEQEGWTIELKYEDDQTSSVKAVSAAQSLLAKGYRLFIGPTWSFEINAVKPILLKSGAIALVPAASSEVIGGSSEGVFGFCPSRKRQTPLLAQWLREKKYQRGFVLTPNGDWGEIHRQVFTEAVRESGGKIVGEDQFDYGADALSLKSILLKAQKEKADIIFVTGAGSDIANMVHARNSAQLPFAIMSTNDIRDARALHLLAPHDLENQVYAMGLTVAPKFISRFKEKFGEEPSLYSDRAYDALRVLAYAVEKTDGSPNAIQSFLKNEADFQGSSGRIRFDEKGDVQDGDYRILSASE